MPWKYVLCVPNYWPWILMEDGFFVSDLLLLMMIGISSPDDDCDEMRIVEMMPLLMMMGDDGGCLWAFLRITSHVFSEPGSQEAAKWRCGSWESIRSWSLYRAVGWFDMICLFNNPFNQGFFLLIFQVLSPSTSGRQALWCEMPTKSDCSLMLNLGWKSLWNSIKFALVALSWKNLLITT